MKYTTMLFVFVITYTQASTQTIDYNDAGNMIQRTVIILSPMMADTTDNDHSHPDPEMGSATQVAEASTDEVDGEREDQTAYSFFNSHKTQDSFVLANGALLLSGGYNKETT